MPNEYLLGPLDFNPGALRARYEQERDRRIRPDGAEQYVSTSGRFRHFNKDPWSDPDFTREPLRDHTSVVVAGGGFGGLLMGARLSEAGFSDIRIIEEGGDFGGTWYWNRYPGAMCDIEAHIYLPLLEELGFTPKHRYAYSDEMLELSQRIGRKYGLYDNACFQTSITDAEWDEGVERWLIRTDRDDAVSADYFILACGRQSLPKLPSLPGIDEFESHIFHSSRWDYEYTKGDSSGGMTGLADKRVGIIGTGATALQIVPEVAKYAKQLLVFQRTPSTVGVRGQQVTGPDWVETTRSGWQRERRDNFQAHVQQGAQADYQRPDLDHVADGWTHACATLSADDSVERRLGRKPTPEELAEISEINDYRLMNEVRGRIDGIVRDKTTAEALKPWYRYWCKRPGWHDDYLAAFNRDNVTLVDTQGNGVERFTRTGVAVNGVEFEVDCLIMATGFEAGITYTHLTGFDIKAGDASLSNHWANGVRTLHGMATDRFPNLFFMGGNQQTAVAVNAVHLLDEQAIYIAHILASVAERGAFRVEARTIDVDNWVDTIRNSPQNQAMLEFYAQCTPGYYNAEGKAKRSEDLFSGGRYGAGPLAYFELLRNWVSDRSLMGYDVKEQTLSSAKI